MSRLRRALSEPLAQFLVLGGAFYAAYALLAGPPPPDRLAATIHVSAADLERAAREEAARTGRRPDLDRLATRLADEELLYREALRLGLDRGDSIVRRRLVQKMEFLSEDSAAVQAPAEAELQAHLASHPERYGSPERVALRHVFFSRERRGDAARLDAGAALDALRQAPPEDQPPPGDPFVHGRELPLRSQDELSRLLGPPFAAAALAAPVGAWTGPIESSYGWHLVHVLRREDAHAADLDAVRGRIEAELLEARRREARAALLQKMRARYEVVVEHPEPVSGGGGRE